MPPSPPLLPCTFTPQPLLLFSLPNTYASPRPPWDGLARAREGVEAPQHGVGSASRTSSGRGRPARPLITPSPYISVRHGTCTTPRPHRPWPPQPYPVTLPLSPCSSHHNHAHLISTLPLPLAPSPSRSKKYTLFKAVIHPPCTGCCYLRPEGEGAAAILAQHGGVDWTDYCLCANAGHLSKV